MAGKLTPIEMVGTLLQKAEDKATTEEEKLVIFGRIQKIAGLHGIDLELARRAIAKGQQREEPTQKTIQLGKRGQHALALYVDLMLTIGRNNDLKATIAHNSTYVNLYGMPSDIAVAEAIYLTAISAMVSLGDAFLKKGEYKKDIQHLRVKIREDNPNYGYGYKETKYVYHWTYVDKPVSGMTARQNFYTGFVEKLGDRLAEARREVRETQLTREQLEILPADQREGVSTDLVLADKAREVDEFYNAKLGHRRLGSWSGSRTPVYSGTARSAGRSAAGGVNLGGSSTSLPGARRQLGN